MTKRCNSNRVSGSAALGLLSPDTAMASMGIYVFNADFLIEQLLQDAANEFSNHDFGKDIIPKVIKKHNVYYYPFVDVQTGQQSYWRDVGTVDAFGRPIWN